MNYYIDAVAKTEQAQDEKKLEKERKEREQRRKKEAQDTLTLEETKEQVIRNSLQYVYDLYMNYT